MPTTNHEWMPKTTLTILKGFLDNPEDFFWLAIYLLKYRRWSCFLNLFSQKPGDFSWLATSLLKSQKWSWILNLFSLYTSMRNCFHNSEITKVLSSLFHSIFLWSYLYLLVIKFKSIYMVFPIRFVIFSKKRVAIKYFERLIQSIMCP